MKNVLAILCVVVAGSGLLIGAQQRQLVVMTFFDDGDVSSLTHYGNCQWLYPLAEPNEALVSEPAYGSDNRVYYAARYGDAADNIHTLVVDESGGTGMGFDTVYADLNNDNRIDSEREKLSFELGTTRSADPTRLKLTIQAGGQTVPYSFQFTAFPYKDDNRHPIEKIHANCRNSSIVIGQAVFDGKKCRIAIADLNSNGLFNDTEQGIFRGDRVFIDLDGDEKFDGRDDPLERYPYGRYTKVAGRWYSIAANPSGTHVDIEQATPPLGTLKASPMVSQVDLHSEEQSQTVAFEEGPAEAIAGTFRLAAMQLTARDKQDRSWTIRNSYRSEAQKEVTIGAGAETSLPLVLPLTAAIEAVSKEPFDQIVLTPKITAAIGGSFRCPRMERQQPNGAFQIVDDQGDVIASGKFEYG